MRNFAIFVFLFALISSFCIIAFSVRKEAEAEEAGSEYIPDKVCRHCHGKIGKRQVETPHYMAFEALKDVDEHENGHCLYCHSTGYDRPGGFENEESTKDLAGVTCQSCHGPGSEHAKKGLKDSERIEALVTDPNSACIRCHKIHVIHPENSPKILPVLKKKVERLQKRIKELEQ